MGVENRFEGCKVLWGRRYRGKFSEMIRYAEAVVKTKDGKLYYVSASFDFGWTDSDVTVNVYEVERFNEETKDFRKGHYVSINLKEWKYLKNLLLEERDNND